MISNLLGFADALRDAKVPISQAEMSDALQATAEIDILVREEYRTALLVTMIKDPAHVGVFNRLFQVFFPNTPLDHDLRPESDDGTSEGPPKDANPEEPLGGVDPDQLRSEIISALREGDLARLRQLIRLAVDRFGGLERGRAVSGVYYTYRTLRQLDTEGILREFLDGLRTQGEEPLEMRLAEEEAQRQVDLLKSLVAEEVSNALVSDRGAEAVAKTLAVTLPEDIDIVHASREELHALQRAMTPLAAKLASRLQQRHRSRAGVQVDFRKTIRGALSSGGIPLEVIFKPPRRSKPEIMLVADISGSVASFARFTMQLVFAMSSQFQKVRSFAFIDEIDEVTEFFGGGRDINEALKLVNTKAKVVWMDGHSDYGHALGGFEERFGSDVGSRTSVIVCGDSRNNYHDANVGALSRVAERAKHVFWLNPEPKSYWDSGDSIVSKYGAVCDGVFECRTLRQLENFVSQAL